MEVRQRIAERIAELSRDDLYTIGEITDMIREEFGINFTTEKVAFLVTMAIIDEFLAEREMLDETYERENDYEV